MTPSARVQAAIELLDLIIEGARNQGAPADRIITAYFKQRRYAGSKDRRAVRELVFDAIRKCGEVPESGRTAMLAQVRAGLVPAELFDGTPHGPSEISPLEEAATLGSLPDWLDKKLAASCVEEAGRSALMERATLDVRVNTLKASAGELSLPQEGEKTALNDALRFEAGTQVEQWDAYRSGAIEVQDLGSQAVCAMIEAQPGQTVIDLCAGAGGKTLALAAAMENTGQLIACDTDRTRLSKLEPRAVRAGVTNTATRLLNPNKEWESLSDLENRADIVLVDAPCSGTGTLRRKPEAKWRISEKQIDQYAALQDRLLQIASRMVKPGGALVFITCSLLDQEGTDRVTQFLQSHGDWSVEQLKSPLGRAHGHGARLEPFHDGTDGFFIASLRSPC